MPSETITQMARDLEPPDPLRMGWERFAVTVGSDQIQEVLAAADRARQAGPPILPEDLEVLQERAREARERTLASKKHALDLALRACVGEVASACAESLKKKDRATLGKALAAARKDVLAVSEQAKALDAPRCLELFAAYALGRVALGEGSLPDDDARSVREALCAAVSKQIYRGDLNLHEPPPVPPENDCFPPQPLECAPPLIFEKVLEDCDLGKEGFVDKMRGAILEMEASLADAPAPAEAEAPAPAPGVPRIAEVGSLVVFCFAATRRRASGEPRPRGGARTRARARFVRALVSPTAVLSSRWHPSRTDPEPCRAGARRGEPQSEARDFGIPSELPSFVDKQLTRRRGSTRSLQKLP